MRDFAGPHLEVEVGPNLCLARPAVNVHLVAQHNNGDLLQRLLVKEAIKDALGLGEALPVKHINDKHYPAACIVALLPVLKAGAREGCAQGVVGERAGAVWGGQRRAGDWIGRACQCARQ